MGRAPSLLTTTSVTRNVAGQIPLGGISLKGFNSMKIRTWRILSHRRPNGVRQIHVEIDVTIAERHETPSSNKTYLRAENYAARIASAVAAFADELAKDVQIVEIHHRGVKMRITDEFEGGTSLAPPREGAA